MERITNTPQWVDISKIPHVLGASMPERLTRWIEYAKAGIMLFDSTQEYDGK